MMGAASDSDWRIYGRLLAYLGPWSGLFALSLFGFLVYSLGNVLLADLFGFLLDALNGSSPDKPGLVGSALQFFQLDNEQDAARQQLARVVVPVGLVLVTALRALGFFLGSWCTQLVARNTIHAIRLELFGRLLLAPASYYDTENRGALVSRMTFTVEQVAGAVTRALKTALREGLVVIVLVSYLFYSNWKLSLVFLAVAPLIALVVSRVGRRFRRYSRGLQASMGDLAQVSGEGMDAYRELRLFGGRKQQLQRFEKASAANRRLNLKIALVDSLGSPVIQTLIALALGALVWIALSPQMLAAFSAGQFAAFMIAAMQLGKPLRQLSGVHAVIQQGLAAAEDIFACLDQDTEADPGQLELSSCRGQVEFQDIEFTYPGSGTPVLEGVSLQIEPGETVALVGRSGSGKSTLVNLLAGFYQPDSGEIRLDGVPIAQLRLANLRAQLALVPQELNLFHDSIYNNIACAGLEEFEPERVMEAASVAAVTEFLPRMSQGMDTVIGEGGSSLSGGQRQRIAIARAVLKDAPVLILDEATSALDADSEHHVRRALEQLTRKRSTLVIAHRLSTVQKADRIVVLDQGRVVAQGTHAELMQGGGLYPRLYHQGFAA
jgi:subfamily B ATP-binding cassette protein MsbA